eukprot:CAMPEP_0115040396 /NCGR_PEP_ID=MMETSP0216-20121206/44760_1 /TAXON_ID=223996 /ORGANISM="Protocruzia adherens, Strain Boccale" /LENGTH=203 /DNA_ID=CAMNT_0002421541 /DNA_START=262 /DNA_END=873 /DNA_ORIENTATION=-
MTTVGYGDYYPVTDEGRATGVIVCFWGVFLVSLTVVSLSNLLEFKLEEQKTYNILKKLYSQKDLRKAAALMISQAIRIKQISRTHGPMSERCFKEEVQYQKLRSQFLAIKRTIRYAYEIPSEEDKAEREFIEMSHRIEDISERMTTMEENQREIKAYLKMLIPRQSKLSNQQDSFQSDTNDTESKESDHGHLPKVDVRRPFGS